MIANFQVSTQDNEQIGSLLPYISDKRNEKPNFFWIGRFGIRPGGCLNGMFYFLKSD